MRIKRHNNNIKNDIIDDHEYDTSLAMTISNRSLNSVNGDGDNQETDDSLFAFPKTTFSTSTASSTQQSLRRRKRIVTVTATVAAAFILLLADCTNTFSRHADAFNTVRPFSTTNKAFVQLHATTRTQDVSLSSSPPPENSSSTSSTTPSSCGSYDRQEFEMQVGRAMDTLRDDYPDILIKDPDYSIYSSDLELIDPSGVHLHGVKNYENAIRLVHALVGIFYCPEQSGLTFRMCFDKARQNIRIHWNARIIPKAIFGGTKSTLHVDGISIYELDRLSGNITQHRLERLVMNDDYVTPEQGVFAALRRHAIQSQVDGIPALSDGHHMDNGHAANNHDSDVNANLDVNIQSTINFPNHILQFKNDKTFSSTRSVLFQDNEENGDDSFSLSKLSFTTASSSRLRLNTLSSSSSHSEKDGLALSTSQQALEKKNSLRKKFGLKPLNMEEFVELEVKVAELDNQQKIKAAAAAVELERAKQQKENNGGLFNRMFGNVMKDTCESNYDCESPEVCCDFMVKKMCCSSGMRVFDSPPPSRYGQLAEVPVPITNPNPYPPNDPRNRDTDYY